MHSKNTLKYLSFVDTQGKTVSSVRYIIRGGSDVTYTTDAYLPLMHDGTVTVESADVTAGELEVTLGNLPDDYLPTASISEFDSTYADGVLSYDATGVQPGSYSVVVSDESSVYAPMSATALLTTDTLPAAFDADSNTIVAADGADVDTFANYLSNLTTATVNDQSYALSGRNSVKIISMETGALNLSVTSGDTAIFGEAGTYQVTVSADGYTTDLCFEVVVSEGGSTTTTTTELVQTTSVTTETTSVQTTTTATTAQTTAAVTTQAATTTAQTTATETAASESTVLLGDVDQDDTISIQDAYQILLYYSNHAAGKTDYTFGSDEAQEASLIEAADVDGDGDIDIQDAYSTLLYYASLSAGKDVTWEDILSA